MEVNKIWYEKTKEDNRDKNRLKCKNRYLNNKEEYHERRREWGKNNPEKVKESDAKKYRKQVCKKALNDIISQIELMSA